MAVKAKSGISGKIKLPSKPKKTCIGRSPRTKLSATSSRPRLKRYRGQGK